VILLSRLTDVLGISESREQDYTTTPADMAKHDILGSQEDMVKLLKAGFSGRHVEITGRK